MSITPHEPTHHTPVHHLGKRTGPKPLFLIEDVVDAAVDLGLDSFTFTGIARKLNVSTPSLYRLVRTRDDVIRLAFHLMARRMPLPSSWDLGEEPDWKEACHRYRDQLYEAMIENHGAAVASFSIPVPEAAFQEFFAELADLLVSLGAPGGKEEIRFLLDALFHTVVTFAARNHYLTLAEDPAAALAEAHAVLKEESGGVPVPRTCLPATPEEGRARLASICSFLVDAWERGARPLN